MNATDNKSEALIEKLSDRNYRTWKTEIKWFLKGIGLLDYALGNIEINEQTTAVETKAHKINNKAIAAIGLSLETNQQIHIEDCSSASEVWRTLE